MALSNAARLSSRRNDRISPTTQEDICIKRNPAEEDDDDDDDCGTMTAK